MLFFIVSYSFPLSDPTLSRPQATAEAAAPPVPGPEVEQAVVAPVFVPLLVPPSLQSSEAGKPVPSQAWAQAALRVLGGDREVHLLQVEDLLLLRVGVSSEQQLLGGTGKSLRN